MKKIIKSLAIAAILTVGIGQGASAAPSSDVVPYIIQDPGGSGGTGGK